MHGNNRFGGISLLDCVVFGRVAGVACAKYVLSDEQRALARMRVAPCTTFRDVSRIQMLYGSVIVGPTLRGAARAARSRRDHGGCWVGGKPGKPRSQTERSGQKPHTPGGTIVRVLPPEVSMVMVAMLSATPVSGLSAVWREDFFPAPPCSCKPVVCVANTLGGQMDWRKSPSFK